MKNSSKTLSKLHSKILEYQKEIEKRQNIIKLKEMKKTKNNKHHSTRSNIDYRMNSTLTTKRKNSKNFDLTTHNFQKINPYNSLYDKNLESHFQKLGFLKILIKQHFV